MAEIGTLKELNVKPGDVVKYVGDNRTLYTVSDKPKNLIHPDGVHHYYWAWDSGKFQQVSRAEPVPKLWRDMSPEEKGALLLAHYEGKVIEWTGYRGSEFRIDSTKSTPVWDDNHAYRVKPEPKVKTVEMSGADVRFSTFFKGHKITFKTIDGKPDCTSIKMEKL